jgi:ATP-binding cassette subfamily F protein 3
MLQEFEGTLLIVSHDRYFLDKLVNRVVEVKDRGLLDHRTTFAAWWQAQASEGGRKGALEDRRRPAEGKEEARREFEERKARQREAARLRSRLKDLEARIERSEARREELKAELEAAYSDGANVRRAESLSREFDALRAEIAALYAEWDEVAGSVEEG